jgi:hypothetical protein
MGTFLTRWKGDIIKEVQHGTEVALGHVPLRMSDCVCVLFKPCCSGGPGGGGWASARTARHTDKCAGQAECPGATWGEVFRGASSASKSGFAGLLAHGAEHACLARTIPTHPIPSPAATHSLVTHSCCSSEGGSAKAKKFLDGTQSGPPVATPRPLPLAAHASTHY